MTTSLSNNHIDLIKILTKEDFVTKFIKVDQNSISEHMV